MLLDTRLPYLVLRPPLSGQVPFCCPSFSHGFLSSLTGLNTMTNTYPSRLYSLQLLLLFSLPSWKNPCSAYVLSTDTNLYAFCLSAHGLKGSDHPRLAVWNSQPQTTSRHGCNQRIQSSNSRLHAQLFQAFFSSSSDI